MKRWSRVGSPLRNYWRNRESAWRRLRILSPFTGQFFTRYDYGRLWQAQGGTSTTPARCGVCHLPLRVKRWEAIGGFGSVGTGQGIDVDHAHSHGLARSLTHGRCNWMVGNLNVHDAEMVLAYLRAWEGRRVP